MFCLDSALICSFFFFFSTGKVLGVGGGLTITGARILLLYPPLMVVLGCF
jgi:hypothetical protein